MRCDASWSLSPSSISAVYAKMNLLPQKGDAAMPSVCAFAALQLHRTRFRTSPIMSVKSSSYAADAAQGRKVALGKQIKMSNESLNRGIESDCAP
jgi:hypothetical protein